MKKIILCTLVLTCVTSFANFSKQEKIRLQLLGWRKAFQKTGILLK